MATAPTPRNALYEEIDRLKAENEKLKEGLKAILSGKYDDYFLDKKCPHCEGAHYKSDQTGRQCYCDPDCGHEKSQAYIKMLLGEAA